jgi:hypothetical protein
MSLLRVNTIESLNGPQGTINMTGNLIVNGVPIAGATGNPGVTGATGATGDPGSGGISGSTVVYVSADSDPATNGAALQAGYEAAKLLTHSAVAPLTWEADIYGTSGQIFTSYGSFLQNTLEKMYTDGGSLPVSCVVAGSPAWYTYDGMGFAFSTTQDMMNPIASGNNVSITTNIYTYTYSTLIIAPGYYQMSSTFNIDTEGVNVTSLSGEPDVFIYWPQNYDMMTGTPSWVYVSANNVTITGISTVLEIPTGPQGLLGSGQIRLGDNLNKLTMKNCIGGDYSFGAGQNQNSFNISGTFINCKVKGSYGFGTNYALISGTFIDCENTSYYGFGYNGCSLSGTFINCKSTNLNGSGGYGFGYGGILSGVFNNCSELGNAGFGQGTSTLSGTFNNCTGGDYCFGSSNNTSNSGVWINCVAGVSCWVGNNNSGTFYNCVGGPSSWTVLNPAAILNHCVIKPLSNTTFGTVDSMFGGRTRYCIDGYGMTNNQG